MTSHQVPNDRRQLEVLLTEGEVTIHKFPQQ